MRRFFFDPTLRDGDQVFLSAEESHHIAKVLRLKTGDSIEILDGLGAVFRAVITTVGRQVEARIEEIMAREVAVGKPIRVWQAILKADKMDWVVQKCTELGVSELIPFHSSRCQGRFDRAQSHKKHQRWQRIGLEACKQCRRLHGIHIETPTDYAASLTKNCTDLPLRLLFWEEEKTTRLAGIGGIDQASSLDLMLGPEGGFTREEIELARRAGWRTVSLGERILRAETATLSAVSIVQFLAGKL